MTILIRKDLIRRLKTVRPALASPLDLQETVLSCFCFTGRQLMACNRQIAVSVPCETDFAGAVPRELLAQLNLSRRNSVELTAAGDALTVVEAGSRLMMPLYPLAAFQALFAMPAMPRGAPALDREQAGRLFDCISGCMRSFGARALVSDLQGMTVIPNGKSVEFYATNGSTISKANLDVDLKCKRRVIIPEAFCRRALAVGRRARSVHLGIAGDHALMAADDVTLWGRLLESERNYDFAGILDHHFPSEAREQTAAMPKGMKGALERALVVLGKNVAAELAAGGGELKISSRSDKADGYDSVPFDAARDVAANFQPELLLAGVDDFDEMLITAECCVMTNERGDVYLVAPVGAA